MDFARSANYLHVLEFKRLTEKERKSVRKIPHRDRSGVNAESERVFLCSLSFPANSIKSHIARNLVLLVCKLLQYRKCLICSSRVRWLGAYFIGSLCPRISYSRLLLFWNFYLLCSNVGSHLGPRPLTCS